MNILIHLFRWFIGFLSLTPIVYGLHTFTNVESIWPFALTALGMFIALCYIAKPLMVRLIAMPLPFRIEENWGSKAAAMQSVTYASFHTNWFSNMTHASIGWEAILWLILAQYYGGYPLLAVAMISVTAQAFSFQDRILSPILAGIWIVIGAVSVLLYFIAPIPVVYISKLLLLSFAIWRWVGHFVEPVPPGIVSEKFTPLSRLRNPLPLIPAAILGSLAELSAGLPYRLFHFWTLYQLQRLGIRPARLMSLDKIQAEKHKVSLDGWKGSSATSYLVMT